MADVSPDPSERQQKVVVLSRNHRIIPRVEGSARLLMTGNLHGPKFQMCMKKFLAYQH